MGEHIITETIKTIVTLDTIELPENPTNGDMIMAIFPNMIDSCWERKKYLSDVCGDYTAIEYTEQWWNAPYKGVSES